MKLADPTAWIGIEYDTYSNKVKSVWIGWLKDNVLSSVGIWILPVPEPEKLVKSI